jgi:hypothetical protein
MPRGSDIQDGEETESEGEATDAARQEDGSLILSILVTLRIS